MKDHIQKTNAVRLLESAGIPFDLVPYEVDEPKGYSGQSDDVVKTLILLIQNLRILEQLVNRTIEYLRKFR